MYNSRNLNRLTMASIIFLGLLFMAEKISSAKEMGKSSATNNDHQFTIYEILAHLGRLYFIYSCLRMSVHLVLLLYLYRYDNIHFPFLKWSIILLALVFALIAITQFLEAFFNN